MVLIQKKEKHNGNAEMKESSHPIHLVETMLVLDNQYNAGHNKYAGSDHIRDMVICNNLEAIFLVVEMYKKNRYTGHSIPAPQNGHGCA